ncbi:PIG-L deacetylase family protein [Kribbella solani]|uniref:LmbE family N-acetylglucosaminyl deacetylase n=1 Tax=Kribbella solani TaxID=236067 RepID=A0A841DV96_9ACTN|nr:PIG-L deacetylase family protein [Kribbella solani]MBB5980197.1 LmbE family N-acetylglucosaminyl deacetylase [Kribbella solani]
MNALEPLEPVVEDWQQALAVVAHPDDLEFGAAAAIARWTGQGKQITYCLLTSGEAGIDGVDPAECGPLREAEQIESSRIVGVSTVEFLGQPDGTIEYGVALRRVITAAIRRHRPEIVITNNFRDSWDGDVLLNQADHINTGRATLDAVRDAANRWIFPDAGDKWDGVRQVWASGSPAARHGVDTTDTFDLGVQSLKAHQAYIDGLGWPDFDPEEFLEGTSRPAGTQLGTKYGTRFEVFTP